MSVVKDAKLTADIQRALPLSWLNTVTHILYHLSYTEYVQRTNKHICYDIIVYSECVSIFNIYLKPLDI